MRILNEVFPDHTLSTEEMKNQLRKILLSERKKQAKESHLWNWGERQFFRAMELFQIKDLNELNQKFHVACYSPIHGELDLTFFSKSDWLIPHINQKRELEDQFQFSTVSKDRPLFCFVPALAASKKGYRLGYGGGYYDRFLKKWNHCVISIVCLPSENFFFDALPMDDQDHRVDVILW